MFADPWRGAPCQAPPVWPAPKTYTGYVPVPPSLQGWAAPGSARPPLVPAQPAFGAGITAADCGQFVWAPDGRTYSWE
eukprot:4864745-Alexandrium_andersonii.AAC.1